MNLRKIALLAALAIGTGAETGLAQTTQAIPAPMPAGPSDPNAPPPVVYASPAAPPAVVYAAPPVVYARRAWSTGPIRPIPRSASESASARAAWPSAASTVPARWSSAASTAPATVTGIANDLT